MQDVVVLLSGGIDSTLCAEMARRDGRLRAVFGIDYGQPARVQELLAADAWATAHNVEYHEIGIDLGRLEDMDAGIGAEGPRVIPGRNAAFLMAVAVRCADVGFSEIWYGAIADDQAEYADCRQDFIDALNVTLSQSMPFPMRVVAPLIAMSKVDIIRRCIDWGIDLSSTWSCYQSTDEGAECETCNSCTAKRSALQVVLSDQLREQSPDRVAGLIDEDGIAGPDKARMSRHGDGHENEQGDEVAHDASLAVLDCTTGDRIGEQGLERKRT